MEYTLEELIEAGVYVPIGVDEDGDRLYDVDLERAKIFSPELWAREQEALDMAILEAVDSGKMEIDWKFDDEGNPTVDYIVRA
jgi:hypothetical protein